MNKLGLFHMQSTSFGAQKRKDLKKSPQDIQAKDKELAAPAADKILIASVRWRFLFCTWLGLKKLQKSSCEKFRALGVCVRIEQKHVWCPFVVSENQRKEDPSFLEDAILTCQEDPLKAALPGGFRCADWWLTPVRDGCVLFLFQTIH